MGLRRFLFAILICCVIAAAAVFAGPISSGALLLLLPSDTPFVQHELPESYEPRHKGGIDTATGLYVREDEDLLLRGTPLLVLRRTYLSRYHTSREFGVGTTPNGEWYLVGDPERFQWVSLILPTGTRIEFERVSAGSSFLNAMYEHRASPSEYQGARVGWTGFGWAMRLRDGSRALFLPCGSKRSPVCSVIQTRDSEGQAIRYRRDRSGRLLRMEASPDRWIAFDYDAQNRITRASDSVGREVRYEYEGRGRLSRVRTFDGKTREYTYTDRDEMQTIADPGIFIENTYDAEGRCIRQVSRFPGEPDPYTFEFTYRVEHGAIVQTDIRQSDGTWTKYTFNENRYPTSEIWGSTGYEPASFTYERDPVTSFATAMTVTCPDRSGRPLRHSSLVRPGYEEWTKWDMLQTHCSWSSWRRDRRTGKASAARQRFGPQ